MKIAQSATKENLLKIINDYYMSQSYIITEDNKVFNTKLNKELGYIKPLKKKFEYHV